MKGFGLQVIGLLEHYDGIYRNPYSVLYAGRDPPTGVLFVMEGSRIDLPIDFCVGPAVRMEKYSVIDNRLNGKQVLRDTETNQAKKNREAPHSSIFPQK